MADLAWLPGFCPRHKGTSALHRHDESGSSQQSPGKHSPGVPSFLSLARHTIAPAVSPTAPPIYAADAPPHLADQEGDRLWHNPSLNQMIEQLKVTMMTKPVLDTLPVHYNVHVLHLLEGYVRLQQQIPELERQVDQARQNLARELKQFMGLSEEWLAREALYKAEIKRLEVVIAKTSRDGLETVALARVGSLVDRTGRNSRQFISRVQQDGNDTAAVTRDRAADDEILGRKPHVQTASLGPRTSILSTTRILDHRSDVRLSQQMRGEQEADAYPRARALRSDLQARASPSDASIQSRQKKVQVDGTLEAENASGMPRLNLETIRPVTPRTYGPAIESSSSMSSASSFEVGPSHVLPPSQNDTSAYAMGGPEWYNRRVDGIFRASTSPTRPLDRTSRANHRRDFSFDAGDDCVSALAIKDAESSREIKDDKQTESLCLTGGATRSSGCGASRMLQG